MVEKFIDDVEKFFQYVGRVEKGETIYAGLAERLAKEQGLGTEQLKEAIGVGVKKQLSSHLQRIREGEDVEVYVGLIDELAKEHNLDKAELRGKIKEAIKVAELRRFTYYLNMIENGNIHLISKAKEMEEKQGIRSQFLEEAIRQGEYVYLVNNIRQIKRGSPFYLEEDTLRNLAKKYGYEAELEEAIQEGRCKIDRSLRAGS